MLVLGKLVIPTSRIRTHRLKEFRWQLSSSAFRDGHFLRGRVNSMHSGRAQHNFHNSHRISIRPLRSEHLVHLNDALSRSSYAWIDTGTLITISKYSSVTAVTTNSNIYSLHSTIILACSRSKGDPNSRTEQKIVSETTHFSFIYARGESEQIWSR